MQVLKIPSYRWLLVVTLIYLMKESLGAKILILTPMGTTSHKNVFMSIADGLAEKGHEVTIVSTIKDSKVRKGVRDIALPVANTAFLFGNIFDEEVQQNLLKTIISESSNLCLQGLKTKEIEQLKKEDFDLVILSMYFDFCYLSLVHQFKAPLVFASPGAFFPPFDTLTGNVVFPSLWKDEFDEWFSFPRPYMSRLKSTAKKLLFHNLLRLIMIPRMEEACRESGLCPPDMPSFVDMSHNASLTMLNRVRLLDSTPTPTLPNLIYIGGIHCREARPLHKDLEEWVTKSEHGFIFFSLGSLITPTSMPENYRKILVKVFGSLKQRVIWKWNLEKMDDLPPNVRLEKWLPQQDILGHKNLKLFITHAGLLSTLEATYHGVPILGMPVSNDQFSNIKESVSEGWASSMKWKDLEEKSFRQLIVDTINNKDFKRVISRRSMLMKDYPRHPKDEVSYWIEYVIKYKGADHIKSPLTKVSTIVLYNMDVWATLLAAVLSLILFVVALIKCLYNTCCKSRSKPNYTKRKRD